MSPVVPAPDDVLPVRRGRPPSNYSVDEMRAFFGNDGRLLGKSTLYRLAERGEIPSEKIGGKRLFPKNRVNPVLIRKGILPETV